MLTYICTSLKRSPVKPDIHDRKTLPAPLREVKHVKQDWHWTDDLAYLLWTTILPLALFGIAIFGGQLDLTAQERSSCATFAMGLKIKEPEKS